MFHKSNLILKIIFMIIQINIMFNYKSKYSNFIISLKEILIIRILNFLLHFLTNFNLNFD